MRLGRRGGHHSAAEAHIILPPRWTSFCNNADDEIWADSAYLSIAIITVLEMMGFESHINERAYRNRPLSKQQIADNRERSKTGVAEIEDEMDNTITE